MTQREKHLLKEQQIKDRWKAKEGLAEFFAENGMLCISQCPEIMQVKSGSRTQAFLTPSPVHWYANDTKLEYLDDDWNVIKKVSECALCGYVHEFKPIVVKFFKK